MRRRILLLISCLVMTSIAFSQINVSLQAGSGTNGMKHVTHKTKKAIRSHRAHQIQPGKAVMGQASTLQSAAALAPQASPLAPAAPIPQYAPLVNVNFADIMPTFSPLQTVVDPFASSLGTDPLKPPRPFWYAADRNGLTVLTLNGNMVVEYIPWTYIPAGTTTPGIPAVLPDGSFVNIVPPAGGFNVVGMTVSYPTEEALASNSETPPTYVYVVVSNSGYEWQTEAAANLPAGRDPNLRDKLVPATSIDTEASMLIQIDVTDPTLPLNDPLVPVAPLSAAFLGHGAGQPAYDPGTGAVYVGNEPSLSLPTTPAVPNDLTSFVSVIAAIAPPEVAAAGEAGAIEVVPPIVLPLESPDILPNTPLAWPFLAEGGEGPFVWEFNNLPSWLTAHADKITGQLDGIVYGTVPATGSWTFQARAIDMGADPSPVPSEWTDITMTANTAAEEQLAGELPFEAGSPNAVAVQGTGSCTPGPSAAVGSMVPNWIDVIQIPGGINAAMPSEVSIGCVIAGTAPISGEAYDFTMPSFKFAYPWDREPVLMSGYVAGAYVFDPLPPGVTISGLAWHEIDKIHDASTEADILNAEFFGVEPLTGQIYHILLPQGALEVSGAIAPPEISVEPDSVSPYTEVLTPLMEARPEITAALAANPNLRVKFGDLVVEANRDPQIYVTARELLDPTGADQTVIPIGGPVGATIDTGAMIKVSGTRDVTDPTILSLSTVNTVALPGLQAYSLGLDSDLAPSVRGTEPGQTDHGVLWVTGPITGNTAVVDTAQGTYSQLLPVPNANSLGGVSVNFATRAAYVVGMPTQSITIFGAEGAAPPQTAPVIWGGVSGVGIELTLAINTQSSIRVLATGSPTPTLSFAGTLPTGLTFVDNGDGTANLVGLVAAGTEGTYTGTITAINGVSPNDTETLSVTVASPPTITSANTTTFVIGTPGTFTVTTNQAVATVSAMGTLPEGLTFVDNEDGTATLSGTPAAGTQGSYPLVITATTGAPPDATQAFTFIVNTTAGAGATMISPASGSSVQSGMPVTFTWTKGGAGVTTTYLWVGSAPGTNQLVNFGGGSATSFTTGNLPVGPIYVRLWSLIGGNLQYQDYAYTGVAPELAAILSPAAGSNIPAGPPVTFNWSSPAGVTTTYLWVGNAPGGNNLVNFGGATATSFTQGNLPAGAIYVRLWSLIGGDLKYKDYTYNAATPELAAMVTPANGGVVPSGAPVTFTWTAGGAGVTTTYLWVGSTLGGNNLVNFGGGSATSFTVGSLPAGPIYVRLWSKMGGQLQYREYAYTAQAAVLAAMITPTNGSTVNNPVAFTWTPGTNVTTTYLWVGSAPGGNNLVNFGGGSATAFTQGNLPAGPIYVRLWSKIGEQLQYQEYAYTVQ